MEVNQPSPPEQVFLSEERAVKLVNEYLSGSYNEDGITRWWTRSRIQLEGLTPQQAWAAGARDSVMELAMTLAVKGN